MTGLLSNEEVKLVFGQKRWHAIERRAILENQLNDRRDEKQVSKMNLPKKS